VNFHTSVQQKAEEVLSKNHWECLQLLTPTETDIMITAGTLHHKTHPRGILAKKVLRLILTVCRRRFCTSSTSTKFLCSNLCPVTVICKYFLWNSQNMNLLELPLRRIVPPTLIIYCVNTLQRHHALGTGRRSTPSDHEGQCNVDFRALMIVDTLTKIDFCTCRCKCY
jgi:hypothetical protein